MQDQAQEKLLNLNRRFYQTFAEPFSETRSRIQPGVIQVAKKTPAGSAILDIGCGNGALANELAALGHRGTYTGIDSSPALIEIARQSARHPAATFLLKEVTDPSWPQDLPGSYDYAFAFALLHHIPGDKSRQRLLKDINALLVPGGRFAFSTWNFLASARLRSRIQPWESIGLEQDDVDPGDYLLDWRRGGVGLRYVHFFQEEEIDQLASQSGFERIEDFYSDGEGGKLGHYHIWKPV
jgi:SAM-dependent methyltransferase